MDKIVKIFMNRDGMAKDEATAWYNEIRTDIQSAIATGNFNEVENILYYEAGLELDYLYDFI